MTAWFSITLRPLRRLFTDLGQRWWSSLARRGLHAWLLELHGVLPAPLRHRVRLGPQAQWLNWPLAESLDPSRPAVLVLPARAVLVQHLDLPTTATRDLQRVLAFEIDKYTPFAAEHVHFTAQVVARTAGKASVLLLAIARDRFAAMLEEACLHGLRVIGIRVLDSHGRTLPGDLLPFALRPKPSVAVRVNAILLGVALGLLAALMATTLSQREAQVQRMRDEVMAQRTEVGELQASEHQWLVSREAASYLSRLKTQRPTLSRVLTELTACLGQDTWIEQLQVQGGVDLSLTGQSKHASALIGRASTCASLQAPQFQGVIQADAQSGNDRFSLVAHLKQESTDAPSPDRQ